MRKKTRYMSLVMAAALMLTLLAGCGSEPGVQETSGPEQDAEGKVWVSEFTELADVDYINQAFSGDGKFYFSYTEYDEENGTSTPRLWCCDTQAGEFTQLPGYVQPEPPEGVEQSYADISALVPTSDGKLLAAEYIGGTKFNLPEGFSGTEEEKYEYAEYVTESSLSILDGTGARTGEIDLTAAGEAAKAALEAQGESYYAESVGNIAPGPDGSILLVYGQRVLVVVDAQGQVLSCEAQEGWLDSPIILPDGRVGFRTNTMDGMAFQIYDFEKKGLGESLALPMNAYQLYPGGGDYDLCYVDSSAVYGLDLESGETERLASLINCDVDDSGMRSMFIGEDGSINCLLSNYELQKVELARIVKKDASEVPEVQTLRLACMGLDSNLRQSILEFNRAGSGVRIEVSDYSQYATEEDYLAGVTKLNTEIISGNVPDLLVADNLPVEQYGAKGLLCDLYEFIDSDSELSRESFFENILASFESDGKLYSIAPGFYVMSLIGRADVVGAEPGWTMDEMMAVIREHPEVQYVMEPYMTQSTMLSTMLTLSLGQYVDWETGECGFDSEGFIEILEFCMEMPSDATSASGESTPAMVSEGRQLLVSMTAADFQEYQMYEAMFGGEIAFKGYPSAERAGNVAAPSGSKLCISSSCQNKDAAWSFLRSMLTEDYYDSDRRYIYGYPLNKAAYDAAEAKAMEKQYTTDPETGEQVEQSVGGWGWDDLYVEIYAMSEEEAQALRELIASVKHSYSYDKTIMEMITEECSSFFAGEKTAQETAALIQNRVSIYVNEQR